MLLRIAWFEVRRRLGMLSTLVYFGIFFAMSLLWMAVAGGAFAHASVDVGAGGKVPINAPFSLLLLTMLGGYFGTTLTAAIAGRATFQDVDHRTTAFFFTAPISKLDYLGGRFLGAFVSVLLLYPGITLGALVGQHLPGIEGARVGPQSAAAYLGPYLTILIPNLVLTSSIFFALATLLRRMVPVYVGAVVLVLGYLIAIGLTSNIDDRTLAALIDPFGGSAAERVTQYWTIAEKSARLVPLTGVFLWNRVLWTAVGLALLALTYVRFSFDERARDPRRAAPLEDHADVAPIVLPPTPTLDFSPRASFAALRELTRLQLKETVRNVFFLVIVLAGVLFVVATGLDADELYGTRTWLVTYEVLEVVGGTFTLFILIVIAFTSGELVWRERDAGLAAIFDALPVPRWVIFTSKLLALMAVQVVLVAAIALAGMGLQAAKGYFHFKLGLYAQELLGVRLLSFWFLCATAMLVHVVVDNKYVGHFVVILFFVAGVALPLLGLEHHLYRLGTVPPWTYSAMNGFGPFVAPIALFEVYWSALAVAFAIVANALWVRGAEPGFRRRAARAWATRSRASVLGLALSLALFASLGGFIFWNTNVRNVYRTSHSKEEDKASFEKKYRKWWGVPQPVVEGVKVACDLSPEVERATVKGTYALKNESPQAIAQIAVNVMPAVKLDELSFGRGERRLVEDTALGFYVVELPAPLAPGERATLTWAFHTERDGFPNSGGDTHVVDNGTFFDSQVAPHLGYEPLRELLDDADRHKFGLEPRRSPPAGDPVGSMHNYVDPDANWVDFEATVSTTGGQLAIAPGILDREWTDPADPNRRFFHYAMRGKILGFYSFLSARYATLKDHWSPPASAMGSSDVAIEIDYHAGHEFDLDRMVKGVKQSLDYCTSRFGPYQHSQVRIVEFPRYQQFAQSFPGTIPFAESIGFIARVDDAKPDDIDYPFYVTAHEVAHQWWAHQVVGGEVQGATLLSESMAQYTALMVMKHAYGPYKMKKFLRYELDAYLHGRSNAKRDEVPIVQVDDQPYIHYSKGSLVMYALADAIGEDVLDAALAKFVAKTRFTGPPYPDAPSFVAALREATPPEYPHLIEDLFETITLYDNRAEEASSVKRADGQYDVTVRVRAKKIRAGALGAETEIPVDDLVDVGVIDKDGKVLALRREKLTTPTATFTLTVDGEPAKAGIDPMNELIDRMPEDNVIKVDRGR